MSQEGEETSNEGISVEEAEKKLSDFYDSRLPFLRKHSEYETLKANIAEAKLKQIVCQHRLAEFSQGPKSEKDNGEKK